jgi:predicted transcriptional regulator
LIKKAEGERWKAKGNLQAANRSPHAASHIKSNDMQLTKAEEQVMQILWDMNNGLVKDIRDSFSDPKPARNTVSTVLRVLEKKGYVGHKAYGNVHLYHPLVTKSDYSKSQLFGLMEGYFNNSFPAMASFFAREKDLTLKELEDLLEDTRRELKRDKKIK